MRDGTCLLAFFVGAGFFGCGDDNHAGPRSSPATGGSLHASGGATTGGTGTGPRGSACAELRDFMLFETELLPFGGAGGAGGVVMSDGAHIERSVTDSPSGMVQCTVPGKPKHVTYLNSAQAVDCGEPHWAYQPVLCGDYAPRYPGTCEGFNLDQWHQQGDSSCAARGCYEQYGCFSDNDCLADEACLCASALQVSPSNVTIHRSLSVCVKADCRTNDDCPSGECGLMSPSSCRSTDARLACRTDADECKSNSECPEVDGYDGRCLVLPGGRSLGLRLLFRL